MMERTTQPQRRTRMQRGFSLIELLIVVSVILIIAAIAIPNFIRSKMRANEVATVQNLRSIATAETVYQTTYGIGYSTNLTRLGGISLIVDATQAGLIDSVLATGKKAGYSFSYSVTASDPLGHPVAFAVTADPLSVGSTGERYFYIDQTNIIRSSNATTATAGDPAI
jgi:type IV pilus assembly protein PilA